jgi:4,5-dihydroxyphthalate decarboxylase
MTEPTTLRTVLASSGLSTSLKQQRISNPLMRFSFADVTPVHKAFAPMVRQQAYDLCELAVVTCLQAVAYARPVVLLPIVVASRFQRGCLITHRQRGVSTPEALVGKRIGVRSYTQTTGMWVRAHLVEDYGLATDSMRWLTRDPAHVEQYQDPPFVEHDTTGKGLVDMLRDGDIDAAIFGNDLPDDDAFVPVIPDARNKDLQGWQRHGFVPINHMMSASLDIARRDPAAVKEAYRLIKDAIHQSAAPDGQPQTTSAGFRQLRAPMAWIIDACLEQRLLPRRLSLDEVFGPAEQLLGGAID